MNPTDVKRLRDLVGYLNRWAAARIKWNRWIDSEYSQRLKLYKAFRARAENALIKAAQILKYTDNRVDISTTAGARAKWKFRHACDKIFVATVMNGHAIFGVKKGRSDKAHIGVDQDIEKSFERLAIAALKDSFQ